MVVRKPSAAIWDWKGAVREAEAARRKRALWRRTALRTVAMAVGAGVLAWRGHPGWALLPLTLALFSLGLTAFSPRAGAGVDRASEWLALALSRAVSGVLVTAVHVLVFVPAGVLFSRGKRDRLERSLDRAAGSYWRKAEPAGDPERMY